MERNQSIIGRNKIYLSEFREFLFKKVVEVDKLKDNKGQSLTKILAFWRRNELIPYIPTGKHLKVSIAQLIWIRILDDLRSINYPVEKMKILCDYFYKDAYFDNLPKKNLEFNRREILRRKKAGSQTEEEEQLLLDIENTLKYDVALTILKFDVNYLSNFVAATISNLEDGAIYIFFDGRVTEYIGMRYWGHKKEQPDIIEPHIRLTISHYLKEFISDDQIDTLLMPQLLNDDEAKVLREMRKKNFKVISIYQNGNSTPLRIESTKDGVITNDKAKQIKEILGLKNYDRIVLDTIDEKSLSFKVTRKKI